MDQARACLLQFVRHQDEDLASITSKLSQLGKFLSLRFAFRGPARASQRRMSIPNNLRVLSLDEVGFLEALECSCSFVESLTLISKQCIDDNGLCLNL